MSKIWNKIYFAFLLLFVTTLGFAQPKVNSPYSRIGMGDIVNQNYAVLRGMGNLSATLQDPYHVNLLNPASLSYLQATSFDVGLNVKYSNLQSSNTEQLDVWSSSLAYLSLAFPIVNPLSEALSRRRSVVEWGMSFALVPYSVVGYNVITEEERRRYRIDL